VVIGSYNGGHARAGLAEDLWTVWVVVWAPLYWKHYGAQNLLYFCDLGNFFISAALWLESPLLFSSQASGLLLFQSLYNHRFTGCGPERQAPHRRHRIHVRQQVRYLSAF